MPEPEPTTASPMARRIYGGAAIAGPALLLASTIAYATEGNDINDGVLGGAIGVWSCFTLLVAVVGLLRLSEHLAPRAAPILATAATIGFTAGAGFNVQAVNLAYFGPDHDFVEVVEGSDSIGILAFLPWGLFAPAALIGTGLLLWRTGAVARWSAALVLAGGVGFVASRPERIVPIAIAADSLLLLGLVPVGLSLLRHGRARPAPLVAAAA